MQKCFALLFEEPTFFQQKTEKGPLHFTLKEKSNHRIARIKRISIRTISLIR